MKKQFRVKRLAGALAILLMAAPVYAQQTSSNLAGRVTANDGAPLVGAEVIIVHTPSGTTSRATTDAQGRYSARGLRVGGPYTVTVTREGFKGESTENVYLALGETAALNVDLDTTATALETIQVVASGSTSVFSPDKFGAGTTLGSEQIDALPSINRNIQDYMRMDPRLAQSDKARGEISVGGQNPRFNAIRIDGVNTSDTFGLESNNFPTLRQPVSMDAIEAINIDISGYDVGITGATGAVVDAVTKSGTNEFHGSVYGVYRDSSWVGDSVTSGAKFTGFNDEQTYGATFGGPLIKDRLFFFANYEKFTRDSAAASFGPIGSGATNIVDIAPDQIAEAQEIARSVYGVDIGGVNSPDSIKEEIEEYAIKLDWNINDNHRATLRYSRLEQVEPRFSSNNTRIALSSNVYDIAKIVETGVIQLFSDWSDSFSTEFKVGMRKYDSLSNVASRLPQISIGFGTSNVDPDLPASPTLLFGADEFRHGNQVSTETLNAYGAGNWYIGDHTLKFGFDYEDNDIFNLYAQNIWGAYEFASLDHFRNGQYAVYRLNAPVPGNSYDSIAMNYTHRNLGVFLQDSWAVNYNLNLLFGVRVDIPDLDDVPAHNLLVQQVYGLDNRQTLDKELWQPRFGFNYTFDSERPTQLRGGLGLFQGAAANVWVGNSYQNSGFGLIGYNSFPSRIDAYTQEQREAIWANLPVTLNPDNPTTPSPASGYQMMVNLMEEGIEQPSVWKANLAFDHELPWHGIVFSAEYLQTQVKNGLHFERLDLGDATLMGPDGRPLYWRNLYGTASGTRANGNTGIGAIADTIPGYENVTGWHNDGVIYLKNTKKGRSDQFTLSLNKPLTDTWGWMLGYTYTSATEVNPLTSSRAISNWNPRAIFSPNEDLAATSNYEIRNRIIGSLTFKKAFFGDYATTATMFYEGRSGLPYSWRFRNDMNGDGYVNDLLYVPSGPGDVMFTGGAEMEQAFFNWLSRNPDLQRYAGGVAERNGSRNPWVNTFDIRISQELPGFFKGHKSELWLDIMNVGNLIDKSWGVIQYQSPFTDMRAVNFQGVDQESGRYIYNFVESQVFTPSITDLQSRWSLQLGFRYKF